jgi:hypothetical protein
MRLSGNGRHCMVCQKTVTDFTAMSDAEILRYMRKAGSQVCGRLMPGQMNRDLMPSPAQRHGGKGWPWLIAGALMTADGAPPEKLVDAAVVVAAHDASVAISEDEFVVGLMPMASADEHELEPMYDPVETPLDTSGLTGTISKITLDSLPLQDISPLDTTAMAPRDTLEDIVMQGDIKFETSVLPDSPITKIKQFITDTLTALRILPKKS